MRPPPRQTKEDFFNAFMRVSRGRANKELIQVVVDNAADAVDWLTEMGISNGRVAAPLELGRRLFIDDSLADGETVSFLVGIAGG